VLIADEKTEVRALIARKLVRCGIMVSEASDGIAVLAKARIESPDLIIMDMWLPGVSGIEVCHQLHRDAVTRHLPVMLLSTGKRGHPGEAGLTEGPVYYLTKPIRPSVLVTRVQALLTMGRHGVPEVAPASS
jgi:DNA-binding response OmpR family regulator